MANVDVFSWDKKVVGSVALSDDVFAQETDTSLLHAMVKYQRDKRQQGTHSTKTRAEVRGGGKKPFRQKGTGNARQGTKRSPLMPGGAILFGPKPRSHATSLPKKVKRLALKVALSYLAKNDRVFVMDSFDFPSAKTKDLNQKLDAFGVEKGLLISNQVSEPLERACRNLKKFQYLSQDGLNVFDLLKYNSLFIEKETAVAVCERLERK